MDESTTSDQRNVGLQTDSEKKYCFSCLCVNEENNVQKYTFECGSLKNILQMDCIYLCYLCKRMAQHTEQFIDNVQSNQILLENFQNVMDETLELVRSQTEPLVNLSQVPFDVIEVLESDSNSTEERFSIVCSRSIRDYVLIKTEMMEEEEYSDHFEAEVYNDDDDTPDIKAISITRKQCMEERARMKQDPKYENFAYKCENCIKGFTFKGAYDKHMEKHSRCMGDYECDICKQRTDTEEKLVDHMRYHFTRYKCPACGLARKCRVTIRDHYNSYHSLGFLTCPYCSKTYKRQGSLRKHIFYGHLRKSRVQCAYCLKTYVDKDALRSHMVLKHSNEVSAGPISKNYVCQECGMACKSPSQLRAHSTKHSDTRDFYCVECDKSFKTAATLNSHLKTASIHVSSIKLPLPCLHCDKRFAIRRNLEIHTNKIHLNIKPFACDRCDKKYFTRASLKKHERRVHDGLKRPKQYPCPRCDKVFDRNQILKSHMRTHTGERPYQCSKCPAAFRQANVLRTHDRIVHLKLTRDGRPSGKKHPALV